MAVGWTKLLDGRTMMLVAQLRRGKILPSTFSRVSYQGGSHTEALASMIVLAG